MANDQNIGPEIHAPSTLHGKRAKMTVNGKEVQGVLLADDPKMDTTKLVFKFTDTNGASCVIPVTDEIRENISDYLLN